MSAWVPMSKQEKKIIAQRRCVGCLKVQDKHQMIRIVRSPDGEVAIDPTFKAPGRGAYLCKDPNCLKLAAKKRRLNHSLRIQVPDELCNRLAEHIVTNIEK